MTTWRETIQLSRPLREVRTGGAPIQSADEDFRRREHEGFERGWREGQAALQQEFLRQRSEWTQLQAGVLESLRQAASQVTRDCEGALVALALEVARKLVADLPISQDVVEAAIREALQEAEENHSVTVLLHPSDLELLQAGDSTLFHAENEAGRLRIHASTDVTRGGCLVRTNFGTIDGRRETKLELLKRSLAA